MQFYQRALNQSKSTSKTSRCNRILLQLNPTFAELLEIPSSIFLPNSIEKLPIPSEPVQIPTQTQSVPSSSRRAMKDDNRLGRTNQFNDPIDFADQMGGGFWALRGGAPRRRPLRHQIPGLRLEQSVPHDGTARAGLRTVRPGQRLRRPPTSLAQFGHIQIPPVVSVPKVIQFNNDYFILHVDRDSFIPPYPRGGGWLTEGVLILPCPFVSI